MARRHSLQNQRPSHGPASSIHEPIVNPVDDPDQEQAGHNKKRKRSTSFTGFFTKFLPSHRPERSGTLREQGFWERQQSQQSDLPVSERRPPLSHRHGSDSIVSSGWNPAIPLPQRSETLLHHRQKRPTPTGEQSNPLGTRPKSLTPRRQRAGDCDKQQESQPTKITKETVHTEAEVISSITSQQPRDPRAPGETVIGRIVSTLDAKRETRRLRRSLKDSGDFLGVQGVNPQTGVMDVLTPTSSSPTDRTMMSAPEPKGHSESMDDFRAEYHHGPRTRDAEEASLERLRQEQERLDKIQRKKDSIRAFQQRVRWRKDTNQWSSVAEPDLSPIADASTRSGTPRSASAGAFVPPPAILKVLRWEEQQQRSASTPAGVPTAASTPQQNRPGIVAQESSDTVIHTPHPAGERRHSMVPDIFRKGYLSTIDSSSPTPRRATEPAADPVVGSPSSSKHNIGLAGTPAPPPKNIQKPSPLKITIPNIGSQTFDPFPMDDQDSFLGRKTEPARAKHRHIRDQAIISPATPTCNNQNENSFLDGPPNMDETPAGSPPTVAVRDFAKGMNHKVWFVQHQSNPGSPSRRSPPRQSHSVDQGQSTKEDTVTSFPSPRRSLPLHREPLISLQQGPSQKSTSLPSGTKIGDTVTGNLIDVGIPSDSKANGWAKQLMEEIASFGQDNPWDPAPRSHPRQSSADISPRTKTVEPLPVPASMPMPVPPPISAPMPTPPAEETTTTTERPRVVIGEPSSRTETTQPRSASIPTTTITGYDPRLLAHTRGLHRQLPRFDGPAESAAHKDDRVIRISAMEAATKLQLEKQRAREERNYDMSRDSRATRESTAELADVEASETDQPPPMMTPAILTSVRRQTQPSFDLLASPPRLPPSVWPSLDIVAPLRQQELSFVAAGGQQPRRATEPAVTEMVPYEPGPQPANGTTSSHQQTSTTATTTDHKDDGEHLSAPTKTSLPCNQEMQQQQQQQPPIIPTTSAPQLAATRDRCEKLYRRVSRRLPKAVTGQGALMTPATTGHNSNTTMGTTYKAGAGPPAGAAAASLTCTSTYHQLEMQMPKYRYMPAHPSSSGSANSSSTSLNSSPASEGAKSRASSPQKKHGGKEAVMTTTNAVAVAVARDEATEAARTALVGTHYSAATGRIVHVRPSSSKGKGKSSGGMISTTEIAAALGPGGVAKQNKKDKRTTPQAGGGDIAGVSNRAEKQPLTGKEGVKKFPLTNDPHHPVQGEKAESLVLRLLAAYWALILPVFEAGSPISKRFSAGQSTWRDCGVYALALVFVLAAFLAAVWAVKAMLLVGALGRAVLRGCLVLVGF
ncbi:hypothetical protein GE09DRAFT_1217088 [Coniochaeta sp. 2T2.1]|nr:hypothetical protein GE09DRAFT_1217088 [Coniochaeta sp. 2T2.1]